MIAAAPPYIDATTPMLSRTMWSSDAACTAKYICVFYFHAPANEVRLWSANCWPWDALACWAWCSTQSPRSRVFVYGSSPDLPEGAALEHLMRHAWRICQK